VSRGRKKGGNKKKELQRCGPERNKKTYEREEGVCAGGGECRMRWGGGKKAGEKGQRKKKR